MSTVKITRPSPVHEDDRGIITDLINTAENPVYHIGMITFTKGAVRANHYHKVSEQYDYILEGSIELVTKETDHPDAEVQTVVMHPGDLAYIPANVIHAYRALTPATIIDMTTRSREATGYEDDTVRAEPIL
ncbi:hypothetical protein COU76_02045 [Candidatus Peregrinibacteria bacterium CG10_big_fil_rev_8_21_14_0_10_49_10]|nr:MAG: hypothetical protein COU76_02045 [Candidatus Peregrinibacteria bacterium CG10_big_fil_rev_8_21_14_0_10_49_10]